MSETAPTMTPDAAPAIDVATLDRLGEKVTTLVKVLEQTQQDLEAAREDNERLTSQLETLQKQVADSEHAVKEVEDLRAEREQVRTRVTDMLGRLEGLDL